MEADPGVYPGSGMGCEYPCEGTADRSGLTPSAGTDVRRDGWTALMYATNVAEVEIVAALLGARADANAQNINGCTFPCGLFGAWSAVADGDADGSRARPSGRKTALHLAADRGFIAVAAELLVGGAFQRITNNEG